MAEGIVIREAHFPGRAPIDAYGNGGFRFAGMSHRGSLLCLPSGIHGWEPEDPDELGTWRFRARVRAGGRDRDPAGRHRQGVEAIAAGTASAFREAGISADAMSTGAAVRTYNVLLAEDRAVAAALVAID